MRRRTTIIFSLLGIVVLLIIFLPFLYDSWFSAQAILDPSKFIVSVVDSNGKAVSGVIVTVNSRFEDKPAYGFPIDNFQEGKILETGRTGIVLLSQKEVADFDVNGNLWWGIAYNVEHYGPPYTIQFSKEGFFQEHLEYIDFYSQSIEIDDTKWAELYDWYGQYVVEIVLQPDT